jgi:hypothetical protein
LAATVMVMVMERLGGGLVKAQIGEQVVSAASGGLVAAAGAGGEQRLVGGVARLGGEPVK